MEKQIPDEAVKRFLNASYRIVGTHSAVSVCHWTKESLRRDRVCYKEKWYGIESHRCLEMTPAIVWCNHRCVFCWRPLNFSIPGEPKPDEPEDIINGCIEERMKLLTGFKGNDLVEEKKWNEAIKPTNAAISLAGEPMMYPLISDLISAFKKRNMSTFLVTNGTRPDRIENLSTEPTNLYITLTAPDKATYLKTSRPVEKDCWKRINKSLELMNSLKCRKVLRLTLVKGVNLKDPEGFAKLVKKANPDVIEPKGYSWVGDSRERLKGENIPTMDDLREFSKILAEKSGYTISDEDKASKVLLLER